MRFDGLTSVRLFLLAAATLTGASAWAQGSPPEPAAVLRQGDLAVSVGRAQVFVFSPTGELRKILKTGSGGQYTAGSTIQPDGSLLVTGFDQSALYRFDRSGRLVGRIGSNWSAPESVIPDANQQFLVGQVEGGGGFVGGDVRGPKLSLITAEGAAVQQFTPRFDRGIDWIDLAADGRTLVYSSESSVIRRYDLALDSPLPDFARLDRAAATGYALRVLADGGLMVAVESASLAEGYIARFDAQGAMRVRYQPDNPRELHKQRLFAMNLDGDGDSFWTAASDDGPLYRIDIESGALLAQFDSLAPSLGIGGEYVAGISVRGELLVGASGAVACPQLQSRSKPGAIQLLWNDHPFDRIVLLRAEQAAGPYSHLVTIEDGQRGYLDREITPAHDYHYLLRAEGEPGTTLCAAEVIADRAPDSVEPQGHRNRVPRITSTPPVRWSAAERLVLPLSAIDPDHGDTVTWTLKQAPAGMAIIDHTVIWPLPAVGDYAIEIEAQDQHGGLIVQPFGLRVDVISAPAGGTPPYITSRPKKLPVIGQVMSYQIAAVDTEGGALSYALVDGPAGASVSGSGLLTYTPAAPGTMMFAVSVSDTTGAKTIQSWMARAVTVAETSFVRFEDAPATTARMGEAYSETVATSGVPAGSQFSLIEHPPGMTLVQNVLAQWQPTAPGTHPVTLRVVSPGGQVAELRWLIEVSDNRAPIIDSITPNNAVLVGIPYQYQVLAHDPDGDAIRYILTRGPDGMTISESGLVVWNEPSISAPNRVGVRVEDPSGNFADQNFTLIIRDGNRAPAITSTPPTVVGLGRTWNYALIVSDPESDTVNAQLLESPAGASLIGQPNPSATIRWTPVASQLGTHRFNLLVTDELGATAEQTFEVLVTEGNNLAPTLNGTPPASYTAGAQYLYNFGFYDADGDPVTLSLVQGPSGAQITNTSGSGARLTWTVPSDQTGLQTFEIKATDTHALSSAQAWTVAPVGTSGNRAPQISNAPPSRVEIGASFTHTISASDLDGDVLAYTAPIKPVGMTLTGNRLDWTPQVGQSGQHPLRIEVSDGRGGLAAQEITISVPTSNAAPRILSSPQALTTEALPYAYQVVATDPEANSIDYALTIGPAGMSMNAVGLIAWANPVLGDFPVTIAVSDGVNTVTQSYVLRVMPPNQPPVILSNPITAGQFGIPYAYQIDAYDPEGRNLTYSFPTAVPPGMRVTPTGLVIWPYPNQAEARDIKVVVSDGALTTAHNYRLTISALALPFNLTHSLSAPRINLGETATARITGVNGVPPYVLRVQVDSGAILNPDANGNVLLSGLTAGVHTIDFLGRDAQTPITELSDRRTLVVLASGSSAPPTAALTAPSDDARITYLSDVVGTATDDGAMRYTLEYSRADQDNWREFASSTTKITNARLGVLDPTALENGFYKIRLTVRDAHDQVATAQTEVEVDGGAKLGMMDLSILDMEVESAGLPLRVVRHYSARRRSEQLDFGHGWSIEFESTVVKKNRATGIGWEIYHPAGSLANCVRPLQSNRINVYLPDGMVYRFKAKLGTDECANFGLPGTAIDFEPQYGTDATLEVLNLPTLEWRSGKLFDMEALETWNPQLFKLTTNDGMIYRILENGGVQNIEDRFGNLVVYGPTGVASNDGQSINFVRDGQGRITEVVDPTGDRIIYSYDGLGDLRAVADRSNRQSRFTYNREHGLVSYTDPGGNTLLRVVYDAAGRVISQFDAGGNSIALTHDTANRKEVVVDRRGNRSEYAFDDRGNVLTIKNPLNQITTYAYNDVDEEISVTNHLGERTERDYSPRRQLLAERDALGHETRYDYNATSPTDIEGSEDALNQRTDYRYDNQGRFNGIEDPAGNATVLGWGSVNDANGNALKMMVDGNGAATHYETDVKGRRVAETDATGARSEYVLDSEGSVTQETRYRVLPDGSTQALVSRTEFDGEGRVTKSVDPLGFTSVTHYNAAGEVASSIDVMGRRTSHSYDTQGRKTGTDYPDAAAKDSFLYDANGNTTSEKLFGQPGVNRTYDALDRVVTETVGTRVSRTEYDAAGRVTKTIDPLNRQTLSGYDAAGRRTSSTDPLGQVTTFAYDAINRLASTTDALNRTTGYSYDAAGRRTQLTHADGQVETASFDGVGRKLTETFAGITKTYRYDAVGRLSEVVETSALGDQTTRYGYDALGQKIAQTDAANRTTRWAYDAGGRVSARTLPDGASESFLWDAIGNLVAYTDFNGDSVVHRYDVMDRKTQTRWPDGREFNHAYDTEGRLVRVDEPLANGGTLTHLHRTFNTFNELSQEQFHNFRKARSWVNYTYDASGARTEVAATSNQSTFRRTKYAFDANGRLSTVTDAANQVTTHHYDAGNRLTRIERPNGIVTHYHYDLRDRITRITHEDGQGLVLLDLQALLDARGLRTQLQETDAAGTTTHQYQYDALARLTQVDSTMPDLSTQSETYTFDAVGNRTQMVEVHTGNGQTRTATTVYVYDDNDRLLSATTSGDRQQHNQYQYNAHGDLLKEIKDRNGVLTTTRFGYDVEHRLISARVIQGVDQGSTANTPDTIAANETLIQYRHDRDGILIGEDRITRANTSGTGGATNVSVPGLRSTDYSIDRSGAYPQILEERDGQSGKLIASHTWGLTHLAETRTQTRSTQCGASQDRTNCTGSEIDQIANPQTSWLLQDHLGSTRALTDTQGILTDRFDYDTYGQLARHNQTRFDQFESIQQLNQSIQSRLDKRTTRHATREHNAAEALLASTQIPSPFAPSLTQAKSTLAQTRSTLKSTAALTPALLETATTKTRHLFTGEQLSADTGLGYHRARWLSTEVGRFTQMDEFSGFAKKPSSQNAYVYASNAPLTNTDPSGYMNLVEVGVSLNIVGTSINVATYAFHIATGNYVGLAENVVEDAASMLIPGGALTKNAKKLGSWFIHGKTFKLGVDASADALRHNMKQVGLPGCVGCAAHHLIPGSESRFYAAREARRILEMHKIDVNSFVNGVFLPTRKSGAPDMFPSSPHVGGHSEQYYDDVLQTLKSYGADNPKNKTALYEALKDIQDRLLNGELRLNSVGL